MLLRADGTFVTVRSAWDGDVWVRACVPARPAPASLGTSPRRRRRVLEQVTTDEDGSYETRRWLDGERLALAETVIRAGEAPVTCKRTFRWARAPAPQRAPTP